MKAQKKREREDNTTLRISFLFAIVVLLLTLGLPKAEAYPVIIEIEATVDIVSDNNNYLEGKINVDDIITGYYIYESTTPDSSPSDPVQGNYWHYEPPAGISLTVGGFDFVTDPCNVEFSVYIRNNNLSGDDIYGVESWNNLPLSNGTSVDFIYWQLNDNTATALMNDSLPTTAPILDDWTSNIFNIIGDTSCEGGTFGIVAHVTTAEIVPEPTTILLLCFGTLLLRIRR